MKKRFLALFTAGVLLSNLSGIALADTKRSKQRRDTGNLVSLLPASDAVAVMDVKRFFGDALPRILASNQPILGEITAKLDEIQSKSGLDLRKFDQIAIGLKMNQVSAKEIDFDPVAIVRGDVSAGALVSVAKLASDGTYREEKVGERTIYIFTPKKVAAKTVAKAGNPGIAGAIERTMSVPSKELALTAYDSSTLVVGTPARVRETLAAKTFVAAEILSLLPVTVSPILSFAARTPTGMTNYLPLANDELGKNLNSIRYVAGSMDVAEGSASLHVMARTLKAEQAQGLLDTIQGLQLIGKAFLGGSKKPEQKIYARLIENARIARTGNDVTLDLSVPQSDIDALVGSIRIGK